MIMMAPVMRSERAQQQARARTDRDAFASVASAIVADDATGNTANDSAAQGFTGEDLCLCW